MTAVRYPEANASSNSSKIPKKSVAIITLMQRKIYIFC